MKTQELRNRVSVIARSQMSVEQISQSLQAMVKDVEQLESDQQKEVFRHHRYFRWLCLTTLTGLLALLLTCCFLYWEGHQLRHQLEQSQTRLTEQQRQLSQQREKLELHQNAIVKILTRITTSRETTPQP